MAHVPGPAPPLPPAPAQVYATLPAPQANISVLQAAMPATSVKLQSILRKPPT